MLYSWDIASHRMDHSSFICLGGLGHWPQDKSLLLSGQICVSENPWAPRGCLCIAGRSPCSCCPGWAQQAPRPIEHGTMMRVTLGALGKALRAQGALHVGWGMSQGAFHMGDCVGWGMTWARGALHVGWGMSWGALHTGDHAGWGISWA